MSAVANRARFVVLRLAGTAAVLVMAWFITGPSRLHGAAGGAEFMALAATGAIGVWLIDVPSAVLAMILAVACSRLTGAAGGVTAESAAAAYRLTPAVIAAIGALTIWDVNRSRSRLPFLAARVRLLVFVALLAAAYAVALFRGDNRHLLTDLWPLSFVLTLAFRDLPSWISTTVIGRAVTRAIVTAVIIWIYPVTPTLTSLYSDLIKPALQSRSA
jgi:hypothetical protein